MHTTPMKYIASVYFQTKQYKSKPAIKLKIKYLLGFLLTIYHKRSKLYSFPSIINKNNPQAINRTKIIIGIPILFQQ